MKIKDLRCNNDTELGNIIEASGDSSMIFCTTDKGYRLIMDKYNMNIISQHIKGSSKK